MAFLTWSGNLPSGFVFNWGDGNVTLTHAAGILTLAGGGIRLPAGALGAPAIGWSANVGLYSDGSNQIRFISNGVDILYIDNTPYLTMPSAGAFAWASGALPAVADTLVLRDSAAVLQMGVDAASPIAQTFKGPDARAGTDTNAVGGRINWRTGLSTGNAVPAIQSLQGGAATVTSGTGAQIVVDRLIPNAFKVLTNNVATAVVNVTVANNTVAGGVLDYVIECTDGTDVQVETGRAVYSTSAKGAVVSGTITEVNSQQNLSGASTLATTWAISNAQPAVISINANSSLVPSTGYPRITFSIKNLGQQAVAIQ